MSVLDLDTATAEFDCKIADCPRTARSNRGRYAYLCDQHSEAVRTETSARIRAGIASKRARDDASASESGPGTNGDRPAVPAADDAREAPTPSLGAIADRIPPAARALEAKLADRRRAREESQAAVRALNEIVGELRAAIAELA